MTLVLTHDAQGNLLNVERRDFTKEAVKMSEEDKCLVRFCPNLKGEGSFVGNLCAACESALRNSGRGSRASAWRIIASVWPMTQSQLYQEEGIA